jgi:hypothetical protein
MIGLMNLQIPGQSSGTAFLISTRTMLPQPPLPTLPGRTTRCQLSRYSDAGANGML